MGVAMAAMHYGAGLSGIDTEVVIAPSPTSRAPKIYIIDHDRNTAMHRMSKGAKIALLSSLLGSGEPYYPLTGPLGVHFTSGYIKKAKDLGHEDIARSVLDTAFEETHVVPPLPL